MSKKCLQMIVLCGGLAGAIACGSAPDSRDGRLVDAGAAGSPTTNSQDSGVAPLDPQERLDAGTGVVPIQPDPEEAKPGECGASSFEAQQITVSREVQVESEVTTTKPVALYVMMDRSASMGPSMSNLWDSAKSAMKSFLSDEKSASIGVGIQYFPISGGTCAGDKYETPAVAVGQLPARADTIATSLDAQSPSGIGTPTEGALRGVTEFCKQYQKDHTDEQCVAVLVTDGKPENYSYLPGGAPACNTTTDTLTGIAKSAHDAGVTTFAVGLKGADFALLDKIAQLGGAPDCDTSVTDYACNVSDGADKLANALTSIRDKVVKTETHTVIETHTEETALPCEWVIPAQPDGRTFDRDKVNIRWKTANADVTFVRVDSEAKCQANAWHFDDAENPTRLVACPQTCDTIQAEPSAKLDVLLGCQTLTPQ